MISALGGRATAGRAIRPCHRPRSSGAALELAQHYGLTPYHAAYLWLAERLEAPLVTFDARLGEAARRHLEGVREGG